MHKKSFLKLVSFGLALVCFISGCKSAEKEGENVKNEELLSYNDSIKTSLVDAVMRDPFVLAYDGYYYVYSTGWKVCKTDDLKLLARVSDCVEKPEDYDGNNWAPEVYYYKDKFYMFTTYRSSKNGHRGCAVFVSDTPEGKFKLHSNGHVTPADWDAIDGTLYIDEDGQPWMIFVHEWTSTDDGIGRMACAKMSEDLTHFISEPVELFRADDPEWTNARITDGCFVYRTKNGSIQMLWSNNDNEGNYCVAIAESKSGNVEGPWTQQESLLYSKELHGLFDGGHGMIFKDFDGYMWMALHSPNSSKQGRKETPIFVPVKEEKNKLVWDRIARE